MNPAIMNLPGHTSRGTQRLAAAAHGPSGRQHRLGEQLRIQYNASYTRPYEEQIADHTIITGTPDTVIPKIRHVLEYLRPGSVIFWDGDGSMDHDDAMRSIRLMGQEVLPAVHEIAKELELYSPYERDLNTGKPVEAVAAAD